MYCDQCYASTKPDVDHKCRTRYVQFVKDMNEHDIDVRPYHGRFYYDGPAVATDEEHDLQDIIRATSLKLQWDQLGLGSIVYPK